MTGSGIIKSSMLRISRRDFMNGVAISLAAGTSLSPLEIIAMENTRAATGVYPPGLTGMRGSHPGSFTVAHAIARGGVKYPRPAEQTEGLYDLVIVGGGISGLAAAFFYRQRVGPEAKILILDNHDDFGGHARRNDFSVDGRDLICHGGSQTIQAPANYSAVSAKLLKDTGIETDRFYEYYDQDYFKNKGLGSAVWFSQEAYGKDVLAPQAFVISRLRPIRRRSVLRLIHTPYRMSRRKPCSSYCKATRTTWPGTAGKKKSNCCARFHTGTFS